MAILLTVSILSFLTLFERGNTNGVVDNVRFIVDSETDGVREISFYFEEPGVVKKCTATALENGDVSFAIEDSDFTYYYNSKDDAVTAKGDDAKGDAFSVYSEKLFLRIAKGPEKFMKFWQAGIVFVISMAGGAIILWSEELWLFIHRKDEREPKWEDLKGIKRIGAGVIALAVIVLILFIIL